MTRPGSLSGADSIPPPSGTSVEAQLDWCVSMLRGPLRHLPARVAALEESLGEEGNESKGRAATGIHLALEKLDAKLDGELQRVLSAVENLGKALAADREEKAQRAAAEAALAKEREPRQKDLAVARAALIGVLVTVLVGAVAARVAIGWREPPTVTVPR